MSSGTNDSSVTSEGEERMEGHAACFKIISLSSSYIPWIRTQEGGPSVTVIVTDSWPMHSGRSHYLCLRFKSIRGKMLTWHVVHVWKSLESVHCFPLMMGAE